MPDRPEYEPLDFSPVANSDQSGLGWDAPLPAGLRFFHGLPFEFKGAEAARARLLAAGGDLGTRPVSIRVMKTATHLVFAHRLLESNIPAGEPVGRLVAEYVVRFEGGTRAVIPVRDRLETGVIPIAWGQWPILATPDRKDGMTARWEGRWGGSGYRQTEATQGWAEWFYLWSWANPDPDRVIESLEVRPAGPKFVLGAVTLSTMAEEPLSRAAKRPVKIVLARPAERPLAVEVDRGVASYPYPLPAAGPDEFLADSMAGWGEAQNGTWSPAWVEIAASPSATVTLKQGDETLGSVRWEELQQTGHASLGDKAELVVVDPGRNWVRTTVVDDATGKPVACRIHFRSPEGIPFQPHGHHTHVNSNLDTWHTDIGGDLRLGQVTYAYINGVCEGWLPRGEVIADIARGYEYAPVRTKVTIAPGQRELTFRLKRVRDMAKEGWYSGDTHVHFLSTQGGHREAAGEGLNVVNLLLSQWGHLFTNTEEFTGGPSVNEQAGTIVYATQENRQHILGHLTLLGLKEPVNPWCSDGPSEAEIGGNLETTLSRWADACHAQGGTVVIPHLPNPNCEPAALIATGRADAVEMIAWEPYLHHEYYRYLNCGYRLPLVGGTDKMSSAVAVGQYRTYVRIPADQPFTYDTWCAAMRSGATFHSGGPLLDLSVEGRPIGATLDLPRGGGQVEVAATMTSVLPVRCLEIIMNGKVVARTESGRPVHALAIREKLTVDRHSWIAARCAGAGYTALPHHDVWSRSIMAHTSPVYLAVGEPWWMFDRSTADYMLTLLHGGIDYVRTRSRQWPEGRVTHSHRHEDHLAYLSEPFQQAIEAIHRRMHQLNIPH